MKINHTLYTFFFVIVLTGTFTITKAQCSFENIVPVKVGMSKFDVRNIINSIPTLYTLVGEISNPLYVKPSYLKGDSIKKEMLIYSVKTNPCTNGKNIHLTLSFADNILYSLELVAEFSENRYKACYEQYQNITSELDKSFSNFKRKREIKVKNEKIGEGYGYEILNNDKEQEEINFSGGIKMNDILIGYEFKGISEPYLYILTYTHVNLFLTKFDGRGY